MRCDSCGREGVSYLVSLDARHGYTRLCADCLAKLGDEAESVASRCPRCGLDAESFRSQGRLGCPACVGSLRRELIAQWRRGGRAASYAGKVPGSGPRAPSPEAETLRAELAAAVAAEDFERAAALRDLLRSGLGCPDPEAGS